MVDFLQDIKARAVKDGKLITPEEFEDFCGRCIYKRDRLFLELVWFAGLNASQIVAIKIENIDLEAKTLKTVRHSHAGNITVHSNECRLIRLCDRLADSISSYLDSEFDERPSSGYLFRRMSRNVSSSEPLAPYSFMLGLNLSRLRKSGGQNKNITVPGLLKGRAVQMIDSGAPMIDICRFFGTSSMETAGIFGHRAIGELKNDGTINSEQE